MKEDKKEYGLRKRNSLENIEKDFNDAIDRLISGSPQNAKLRLLASTGSLKINSQTVAIEAGRSRTLISLKSCRLPLIRDRIIALSTRRPYRRGSSHKSGIIELQEEIAELRDQLAAALECQAQHLLAREKAERESAKWRDAFRRQTDERKGTTNVSNLRPSPKD